MDKYITAIYTKTSSGDEDVYLMRTSISDKDDGFKRQLYTFIAKELKYEIECFVEEAKECEGLDKNFDELLESNPEQLIELAHIILITTTEPL